MKLSVGYQPCDGLADAVIELRERVYDVYFSPAGEPSGRSTAASPASSRDRQYGDLEKLSDAGIALNLLLNANCYGADSLSPEFYERAGDTLERFTRELNAASVTTASPMLARFVKLNFPRLATRASVNVGVGTIGAAEYLGDRFDGFYIRRELNRDLKTAKKLASELMSRGKAAFLLANSGCLNDCPARTFHDNLVAHERELTPDALEFKPLCREFLADERRRSELFRYTNFIRPEELHLFDGSFAAAKIATRASRDPVSILRAYASERYRGNLLDLTEPSYSGSFYPKIIENSLIPDGFGEIYTSCPRDCGSCGACRHAVGTAAVELY